MLQKKIKTIYLVLFVILGSLIMAASWPVKGFPVLLFIGFVPLLLVEEYMHVNRSFFAKSAFFWITFLFFLIWNIFSSWWLKNASLFGVVAAVMLNTILMTLVFRIFHGSRKVFRNGRLAYPALIVYWLAFEYLHHHWDLMYPWLSLGNGFAMWPSWIQWYEFTGMPGGTIWILVANILIFSGLKYLLFEKQKRTAFIYFGSVLLLVLIPLGISLSIYNSYEEGKDKVDVVLVQPNNDPYNAQYTIPPLTVIGNMLTQAESLIDEETDMVVFPESVIQDAIYERHLRDSESVDSLIRFVERHPQIILVAGASSFKMFLKGDTLTDSKRWMESYGWYSRYYGTPYDSLTGWYDAYNVALIIDTGNTIGKYHKSRLVAGVERMPFKKQLGDLLGDIALDLGGTVGTIASDPVRRSFYNKKLDKKYGVSICYESVFGDFFNGFVRNGAEYMLIITNDGWWGNTPGHRHHMSFSAVRAIETRRSIGRSANTGITCYITEKGEILDQTEYWVPDAIKAQLTCNDKITFYVKYGDYIYRSAAFIGIALMLIQLVLRFIPRRKEELI